MATPMRAKMKIESVKQARYSKDEGYTSEVITFRAVPKKDAYNPDGADEDNTYAKFSPTASLEITIANPALLGKLNPQEVYYVDFTPVEEA